MNQDLIAAIVAIVVSNWVIVGPIIKWSIKTAWEKSREWDEMQTAILNLIEAEKQLQRDLKAAHDKIRILESKK